VCFALYSAGKVRNLGLELLADRLVELKVVDSISYETVRQELKKREFDLV
jgi:hypothetical protein